MLKGCCTHACLITPAGLQMQIKYNFLDKSNCVSTAQASSIIEKEKGFRNHPGNLLKNCNFTHINSIPTRLIHKTEKNVVS